MKTFLITHIKSKATLLFEFDDNGVIKAFKSDIKSTEKTADFYRKVFPFETENLQYFKTSKDFSVTEVLQDISFVAFWQAYNNKVGNKPRAQKLYQALTDVEKAKAISYIKKYDSILANGNVQKLYPETYINQKRFNND